MGWIETFVPSGVLSKHLIWVRTLVQRLFLDLYRTRSEMKCFERKHSIEKVSIFPTMKYNFIAGRSLHATPHRLISNAPSELVS